MFDDGKHFNELRCFFQDVDRADVSEEYKLPFKDFQLLLGLPWWKWVWVVQDMVLPPDIQFVYASEAFSFQKLKSVMESLHSHSACCNSDWMRLRGTGFDPLMVFEELREPMVSTREGGGASKLPSRCSS